MKTCSRCKERLPFDRFPRRSSSSPARRSTCRDCMSAKQLERYRQDPLRAREAHLRRAHGITIEEYDRLLEAQDGRCAICRQAPGERSLHVDHDHESGRIRGLLCVGCNTGLGGFRDDPERLDAARRYLTDEAPIFFASNRNHTAVVTAHLFDRCGHD